MAKAKRMEDLDITQVAGVDHPAHLLEGWAVMKAASTDLGPDIAQAITAASLAKAGRKLSGPRLLALRSAAEQLAAVIAEVDPEEVLPVGELTKSTTADTDTDDTDTGAADDDAVQPDELLKSLPEPLRKRFTELESTVSTQAEELRKERERRADESAIAKARGWEHLPGVVPSEFGPVLRKVAETHPDEAVVIEKALADANEAIATGALYKEIGRAGSGDVGGNGSYGRLEALAKARVAETNEPFAVAFDAITQTNEGRALLDQHTAEVREGRR